MRNLAIATVLAAASALSMSNSASANFTFPTINGHNPGFVITFGAGGTSNVTVTGETPYDGIEDTYIGVLNNSGASISSFPISSTLQIFSFDGDGITVYPGGGPANAQDTGPFGGGYGGPNGFFTGINGALTAGTVNFINPILDGSGDFFSLELDIAGTQGGGIAVGAVPEPSTWAMMLIGFAGLGFLSFRKSKPRNSVLAHA